MFRLALKMSLARKSRLALTSLAIILGTSFLSGTTIFTDTINNTFERLFTDVFRGVDAYVRSSSSIDTNFGESRRGPTPISALETVLSVKGVSAAVGDMQGFARVIGKDGKPLKSALPNKKVLEHAEAFFRYASKDGKRGTPHQL